MATSSTSSRLLRVTTRCRTVDEFVAKFARLVDERSILLLTDDRLPVGQREPFAIELRDGTPVLRGEAEVAASSPPPDGGLRLEFIALDDDAREVHRRMLRPPPGRVATPLPPIPALPARLSPSARARASAGPATDHPRGTTRMFGLEPPRSLAPAHAIRRWSPPPRGVEDDDTATVRMPPLFVEDPPALAQVAPDQIEELMTLPGPSMIARTTRYRPLRAGGRRPRRVLVIAAAVALVGALAVLLASRGADAPAAMPAPAASGTGPEAVPAPGPGTTPATVAPRRAVPPARHHRAGRGPGLR